MLVRISDKGWRLLDNKKLAQHVLSAIIRKHQNFEEGSPIDVDGSTIKVQMVTSIADEAKTKNKAST